jgi:Holliday junction resolvase RusA-like endonuclease
MLAFVLACAVSLVLAVLLLRQVGMTRRVEEGLGEWKQLYEQAHRDRAALLKRSRELERRDNGSPLRSESDFRGLASRSSGARGRQQSRPPSAVPTEPTTKAAAPVAKPLTLVLPIQLLSKNARDKLHYRARHKLRQDYRDIIQTKYRKAVTPQVRQRVTVMRVKGKGERDFDQQNIGAGSAIELIDALTAAGYWVDDAPRWLETEFRQGTSEKVKGPAVLVEIEPLP